MSAILHSVVFSIDQDFGALQRGDFFHTFEDESEPGIGERQMPSAGGDDGENDCVNMGISG